MKEYTITCYLLNGLMKCFVVETNNISHTIREIEETYDSIGTPIEDINYERR